MEDLRQKLLQAVLSETEITSGKVSLTYNSKPVRDKKEAITKTLIVDFPYVGAQGDVIFPGEKRRNSDVPKDVMLRIVAEERVNLADGTKRYHVYGRKAFMPTPSEFGIPVRILKAVEERFGQKISISR